MSNSTWFINVSYYLSIVNNLGCGSGDYEDLGWILFTSGRSENHTKLILL